MADRAEINQARVTAQSRYRIGECDIHELVIKLDPDLPPDQLAVTLLHEVLHGIWYVGANLAGKVTQEDAIDALTPTLLDTLRRNPALVSAILTEEYDT